MLDDFKNAQLDHAPGLHLGGNAADRVITDDDFSEAVTEISTWDGYTPTPLIELPSLAKTAGVAAISYKHEGPRFGLGSFKALGGAYAAAHVVRGEISKAQGQAISLSDVSNPEYAELAAKVTLVTATDGNHGRSVAWGARRLGSPCRIYIHAEVSAGREQAMRDLGAEVIRVNGDYDASVAVTRDDAEENGWIVVSDTSWPGYQEIPRQVMAGYGVMAGEVADAMNPPPSHVFLQGGVGGLAGAVAARFKQIWGDSTPRAVVVEPELAPCLLKSAEAGHATTAPIEEETLMAGLSCGEPSEIAWEILADEASDFLTIPESLVGPAVRLMARPLDGDPVIEAGESGIAGLAGFLAAAMQTDLRGKLKLDENSHVLMIGSEGVTDPEIFARIMSED